MSPVIVLPAQFNGWTLSRTAADIIRCWSPEGAPPEILFDFSQLNAIRPAGVVFLSNLIWWLYQQGCRVRFVGTEAPSAALSFLDDSMFFAQHCGNPLRRDAAPLATIRPLMQIAHERSHAWLEQNLLPWLASRLRIPEASLYSFKACISELFNNIKDHTVLDVGSIFPKNDVSPYRSRISGSVFQPMFEPR
jgi:hypothetical protein